MKKILLFPFLFLILIVVVNAQGEGSYGSGAYRVASYGISSLAELSTTEEVVAVANTSITIGTSNETNATIEIFVNFDASGSITVTQFNSLPSTVGAAPATSLNKLIDIAIAAALSNSLNHSIIKLKYSQSEVSAANLQESTMRIYRWNGTDWNIFNGPGVGGVDTTNKFVFANTTTFSTFGIFGTAVPSPVSGSGGDVVPGSGGGGGGGFTQQTTKEETEEENVEEEEEPIEEEEITPLGKLLFDIFTKKQDEVEEGDTEQTTATTTGFLGITGKTIQNIIGEGSTVTLILIVIFIVVLGIVGYLSFLRKNKNI